MATEADRVTVRVVAADSEHMTFRLSTTATLERMMNLYASRRASDPASMVFLYDGSRIRATQTPAELDMQDNDVIDVMIHQTGGA